MRRSAKKINSRDAFAAVFEEQTRRFSAFELLGLSAEPSAQLPQSSHEQVKLPLAKNLAQDISQAEVLVPGSQVEVLKPNPRVEVLGPDSLEKVNTSSSQAEVLVPDSQVEVLKPNPRVEVLGPDSLEKVNTSSSQAEVLVPDSQVEVLVQYGPTQALTVDPQYLDLTVRSDLGLTPPQLGPDRQALALMNSHAAKPLAPLQWAVWCVLQRIESSRQTISYRQIAHETKATVDGVKKAINVIQKEGGILRREVVRSATEQGVRITLNHEVAFRAASLNETKGVLKRGVSMGLTGGGQVQALMPDGRRLYVCNYIKHTDVDALLRIPPVEWKIREQTLLQIAETLPDMTAIEFRLSLTYLVQQEKMSKEPIRNHNAWIKAAFEKNKGPLVTEREIEIRFQQTSLKRESQKPQSNEQDHNGESELFRLYLACSPDERAQIDLIAEAKAAPLLKIVSKDKRGGVIEEARREAAREFLFKKS